MEGTTIHPNVSIKQVNKQARKQSNMCARQTIVQAIKQTSKQNHTDTEMIIYTHPQASLLACFVCLLVCWFRVLVLLVLPVSWFVGWLAGWLVCAYVFVCELGCFVWT